jgi:integrase
MARKGENIFKRKDGRWEGRYIKGRENGKAVYGYVFGKSYSEAKKKKAEAMKGISSSTRPTSHRIQRTRLDSQVSEQPLMRDVAYKWLEELKTTRRRSTTTKYEGQLRNHIIPEFGERHIDDISNKDLISFSQKLLHKRGRSGRVLSPRTVADIIARMKSIRKFSLLHGYEVRYVSDCIEIPQKSEKIRVLSAEEEKKLVAYLKENFNLTSLGIMLSLFTGIRLGELCALKWSDFSLEDRDFHVCKTMQRLPNPDKTARKKTQVEIGEPKSPSSVRTIPLSEKFMDYLRPSYAEDAYVLSGHKYYFIEPRTMENRFKSVLKRCGIENTNFHALRHTFATRCVEIGFDVKTLSEILGHASVNMTLNRYVHPSMKTKRENMEKLNELF